MSKRTTRIYHGGPANTGSGGSGYPSPSDRLLDQLAAVLLQGISDVVHLLPGKSIEVDADLFTYVVGTTIILSNGAVDFSSEVDMTIYSSGNSSFAGINTHIEAINVLELEGGLLGIHLTGVKSGISQAAAGALAGELWLDTTVSVYKCGV